MYTTEILKSNICNYNNANILEGDVTIIGHNVTQVAFKNCASFTKCISNWWDNNRWFWRYRFCYAVV